MNEDRLGVLIDRLARDLRDELPRDVIAKLVLYVAASELLFDEWQPADAGQLRFAVVRLALETIGITDTGIERAKVQLSTGRDPDTLNWRN